MYDTYRNKYISFAALYAVFAFRKMKMIWNSNGKPEYVKS